MAKVLFISEKTIGENMSGLGIRVWELAKVLAKEHTVTIITPSGCNQTFLGIKMYAISFGNMVKQIRAADVIIVQIFFLRLHWLLFAWLLGKNIVIDAYSPFYLEHLETFRKEAARSRLMQKIDAARIEFLFNIGDFFLCASHRQKDLWLQWFTAIKRKNPTIAIVPTGITDEPPIKHKGMFKGMIPGIATTDKVVLWSSGIWPWLDPISAIKAIDLIQDNSIKLVFFGLKVVDGTVSGNEQPQLTAAVDLAKEKGMLNSRVFFVRERTAYDERANYLLDADIALNLHYDHLETRYAFRGRILDYIWAGLPLVATRGDVLTEEVADRKMGIVVDYENEGQVAAAILKLISDRDLYAQSHSNMVQYAGSLHWSKVSEPLRRYCALPVFQRKSYTNLISLLYILLTTYGLSCLYLCRYKRKK